MDFKEKKKISHFWDNFSRAAFFIPGDLPKTIFGFGLSAASKSGSTSIDKTRFGQVKAKVIHWDQ
jgi:hypothetical protein